MHLAQLTLTSPSTIFTTYTDLPTLIVSRILIFAISIAGFIFLFRTISAGFAFLNSRGDPAKIQAATQGLTNGLIGLVVVVTAFFIAQIIQTVFGLKIL
jgi:hypothetical protein